MKTKTILAAIALTLAPTFAFAMGCGADHNQQASSCKAGTSWDADTGSCKADAST